MEAQNPEELPSAQPGNRVIRVRRPSRLQPRLMSWRELVGVIKSVVFETPLFVMASILLVLLLLFSAGIYFAEYGAAGSNVDSFGEAVWDGVVLMTTAGAMSEPVTAAGHVLGGIWTVLGCALFYGTIIVSASAYFLLPFTAFFLLPRKSREAARIGTMQYDLGRLDDLSDDDLESLKHEMAILIDAVRQRRAKPE
jgi:voltage-gated potassium channel